MTAFQLNLFLGPINNLIAIEIENKTSLFTIYSLATQYLCQLFNMLRHSMDKRFVKPSTLHTPIKCS